MSNNKKLENHYFEDALLVAQTAHKGQTDKRGDPYIFHVIRVACAAQTDDEIVLSFLHDCVEDSEGRVTVNDFKLVFPENIVLALDAITRRLGETYFNYIRRCKKNPLSLQVKIYDLLDNIEGPQDFKGCESLTERYEKALGILAGLGE